jgi:hypothetical protein
MRSPFFEKPTTEGSNRDPSAVEITTGSPASITATTLFVVPRSIPIILDIALSFLELSFRIVEKSKNLVNDL